MNRLPDDALIRVAAKIPDLWQQEAVSALRDGWDVVVDAPTGAGKTRIFELFCEDGLLHRPGQAVYTVPTRALANEKYAEWKAAGWPVGIATGDLAIETEAPFLVATLETQRERLLQARGPRLLVIDEYQMLRDPVRGLNYELAIALAAPTTQLLLLSGSVGNPEAVQAWLQRIGRRARLVQVRQRPVPLDEVLPDALPPAPAETSGSWPRLVVRALLAELGPILVFAPRRGDAERIARKIANALPPDPPLNAATLAPFRPDSATEFLLSRRVGCHHSGMPYRLRAGLLEPLAKAGQLRVVVATMGLAAGINFSVRSVLVTGTRYFDGSVERELRPDELLQMFGRAGRRGLDDLGTILVGRGTPRLADAAPASLQRRDEVDWPALFRLMAGIRENQSPFDAARSFCDRLFTRSRIPLGDEPSTKPGGGAANDRFGPVREELLNSEGEWEPAKGALRSEQALANLYSRRNEQWIPALRNPDLIRGVGPGSVTRTRDGKRSIYRKALPFARAEAPEAFEPLPWLRKRLGLGRLERFSQEEVEEVLLGQVGKALAPIRVTGIVARGRLLDLELDVSQVKFPATRDRRGRWLIDPPRRMKAVRNETAYRRAGGEAFEPRPGSPAHYWRVLGLLDADGRPTTRGRIFSLFANGEGLMVAAALEDETYPISDLARHLANLRAGHRFGELPGPSEILAAAARARFGHRDVPGYLRDGVCPAYGEGASEIIQHFLANGRIPPMPSGDELSPGDVERAILEWMSLLRHIASAPEMQDARWMSLRSEARTVVRQTEPRHRPRHALAERVYPPQTRLRRLRLVGRNSLGF